MRLKLFNRHRRHKFRVYRYTGRHRRTEAEKRIIDFLAAAVVIALMLITLNSLIGKSEKRTEISPKDLAAFRIPAGTITDLSDLAVKYNIDYSELLTVYSMDNGFFSQKSEVMTNVSAIEAKYILNYSDIKRNFSGKEYHEYFSMMASVFAEVRCFPIPAGYNEADYMYGDSYGVSRNYGNETIHVGTDILDRENIRGRMEVLSMTDGTVFNSGWGDRSGYYVGIKTVSGNYYFYAHLSEIAKDVKNGDYVSAGQNIGRMGDTGYSKEPGTTGNFPVHLHVEISPKTSIAKDLALNPYPVLRYIEYQEREARNVLEN